MSEEWLLSLVSSAIAPDADKITRRIQIAVNNLFIIFTFSLTLDKRFKPLVSA